MVIELESFISFRCPFPFFDWHLATGAQKDFTEGHPYTPFQRPRVPSHIVSEAPSLRLPAL
jgi:hypothetical protein